MEPQNPLLEAPAAGQTRDGVAMVPHDAIAEIILDRPAVLNALDLAMWGRVAAVFEELADRPRIRVVVIRGSGRRAFSAGADIAEFRERRMGIAKASDYDAAIAKALRAIRETPQPVVAMIGGLAVGGGCEIAAAADIRIAGDDSRFGIPIGRIGVTLGESEAAAIVALIGPGQTKRLVFSGQLVDAAEALRIGLVDQVVPREALERETWALAEAIAAAAPIAARANKLVVDLLTHGSTARRQETLHRLTAEAYESPDLQEGIDAFLEKRPPRFTGDADG